MADPKYTCAPAQNLSTLTPKNGEITTPTTVDARAQERELIVRIRPGGSHYWIFEGTRAQLEAEVAIPASLDWPVRGHGVRWEHDRFSYFLNNRRPDDFKGSRKQAQALDWWVLVCEVTDWPSALSYQTRDRQREWEAARYRETPQGHAEWVEELRRVAAARRDLAFRAFKARIPALAARKRSGKASSTKTEG